MGDEARRDGILLRGWRNVREAGPQRLALTALLLLAALLIARFSWAVVVIGEAERELYDHRAFTQVERAGQDPRVLLVVYTDQTLIEARKRSPLDRGLLAQALRNIDGLGAKAIGIDILFDQPQDEDDELVEVLRNMRTPVSLAYAEQASNRENIVYDQERYLRDFLARLEGGGVRAASVRLDNDGSVTRNWPDIVPGLPPLLGRAMLESAGEGGKTLPGYTGSMRYRLAANANAPVFNSLPIDAVLDPEVAPFLAEAIAGRYVLIGGDLVDTDRVETPFTGSTEAVAGDPAAGIEPGESEIGTIPGIEAHAAMIAQMLDGDAPPRPHPLTLWAIALGVVLAASLTALLEWRGWRVYSLVGLQFAAMLAAPYLVHAQGIDTYGLPAFGWVIGWIVAFAAVTAAARAAGAVQRNFAQGALGKYLPREMAREIIERPELLALHGEKKPICVLFSDLEGFTKMSHALAPEMVAKLLNRYLALLSQVVLDHGGVIDKFVGDAVVAFWGAPIARPDDATRAAKAGYAIWQAGEAFRAEVATMDPDLPPVGKTRVGLHYGEAVVGNFGGDTRIQYTALGDSMNTAARLEAANKVLDSSVMASREFVERAGLDWWRAMGRVVLRGRAQPVEIYEPAPDFPEADRAALERAAGLLDSDREAAERIVSEVATRHRKDKALANLLYRVQNAQEGSAYVVG